MSTEDTNKSTGASCLMSAIIAALATLLIPWIASLIFHYWAWVTSIMDP